MSLCALASRSSSSRLWSSVCSLKEVSLGFDDHLGPAALFRRYRSQRRFSSKCILAVSCMSCAARTLTSKFLPSARVVGSFQDLFGKEFNEITVEGTPVRNLQGSCGFQHFLSQQRLKSTRQFVVFCDCTVRQLPELRELPASTIEILGLSLFALNSAVSRTAWYRRLC